MVSSVESEQVFGLHRCPRVGARLSPARLPAWASMGARCCETSSVAAESPVHAGTPLFPHRSRSCEHTLEPGRPRLGHRWSIQSSYSCVACSVVFVWCFKHTQHEHNTVLRLQVKTQQPVGFSHNLLVFMRTGASFFGHGYDPPPVACLTPATRVGAGTPGVETL